MNKLFCLVVLVGAFFNSYSQRKAGAPQQIDEAQIPAAVKAAQKSSFPDITVTRWEMRSSQGAGQTASKYTAVFSHENKTLRARYKGDGTLVSSSKYFTKDNAPSQIKNLGSKYNEYELAAAEEIKTYAKGGKVFYRAHYYKGKKKTVVYVDDNGKELAADKVLVEAKEDEQIEG